MAVARKEKGERKAEEKGESGPDGINRNPPCWKGRGGSERSSPRWGWSAALIASWRVERGALCAMNLGKGRLFILMRSLAPLWRAQCPQRGGPTGGVLASPAFS